MAPRFAAAIVRIRYLIAAGWILLAVLAATQLPSLEDAGPGGLSSLVPLGADALEAERRSAELFLFPFASRTQVVERDADGLGVDRLLKAGRLIADVNRGRIEALRDAEGAYGVTNGIPGLPFARERGTASVTALLFGFDIGPTAQTNRGETYAEALDPPASSFVGVTGVIPARAEQGRLIRERLPVVELATVLLIALTVGIFLRSIVAPIVTLVTVGVAYIVSIRLVAVLGEALNVAVPREVEPVLVVLLFGIVTDYALFFMSRFKVLVAGGTGGVEAARRTTAELSPIVLTCGLAVAAGSGALAIAELGFLRAFGPGMAMAVLVGLVVVLTLLPALMAMCGAKLFWPSTPRRPTARVAGRSRATRIITYAVKRPKTTIVGALALIALMGSGILWMDLGDPQIRGLPDGSGPLVAYEEVSEAFAPGVVSPITMIVEGEGITRQRSELGALQAVLAAQPGIAGVLGPADQPVEGEFGAVLSRTGNAARFVLVTETDPLGAAAIRRLGNLEARADGLVDAVGLPAGSRTSFAGDTAIVAETMALANDDLLVVLPAVLIAVALVLVAFLRALLAPLYLVVLAALAPLSALGLTVGLFQGILGHSELTYFVPIVACVLLVSLGSDYNVFIAGSIWAEARHRPLREAVIAGGSGAAHAIAAAGMVLAASFAALALVPIQAFQELAFVLAAGLLIDAFLIRLVLAPAVIVIAERRRSATLRS